MGLTHALETPLLSTELYKWQAATCHFTRCKYLWQEFQKICTVVTAKHIGQKVGIGTECFFADFTVSTDSNS